MAEKKPLINYSGIIKELQSGDTLPASDNLVGFTSALNTAAPNDTANTSSLTASGGTTNQDAAIVPKGDGALLVQVPDGTASRGNKRGNKSVDLQMSRATGSHVASGGFSSITGGHNNIASGSYSVVSGGANNEATANCTTALGGYSNSATYDFATVSGGAENVASGEYSTISGGSYNTASGDNATISGGASHDAQGDYNVIAGGLNNLTANNSTTVSGGEDNAASINYATVSGGKSNQATNEAATVAGGISNQSTAIRSSVSGGSANLASGDYSSILGGNNNTSSGTNSSVLGGRYLKLGNYSAGYNASSTNTTVDLSATTNIFITNDADLIIGNTSNTAMSIRLYEPNTSFSYTGANYTAFKAQAQSGNVTYTLPASDGTSGQMLTTDGSGALSWASVVLTITGFTAALNTASPNNTVNASSLTASGGTTNQDAVIAPKGTGALLANIPDGGATGGNKRGSYAVDLQTYRTVNTQVASGNYSTIAGGYGNTASGIYSAVLGGQNNTASMSQATVCGGGYNTASGALSVVCGGQNNTASGDYSAVLGGESNTASGSNSAVLGGRKLNVGNYSAGYNASTSGTTVDLSSQTNLFVTNDANLAIGNTSGSAKELRLYEPNTSFSYSGANYTAFKAQAQSGNVTYTLPASDGTSGQSLTTNGGGTLAWASVVGLTGFTSALNTASPNNSIYASSLTASGGGAHQDAVIAPKGIGALLANIPDNTSIGGNKRGSNAVDLQTKRSMNTQVASGAYSTIAGGQNNTASGTNATVSGGQNNTASTSQATVCGGGNNTASGGSSVVCGGSSNTASSSGSAVIGGYSNTASDYGSAVIGGYGNTASGYEAAVLGGDSNTASGSYSAVLGGRKLNVGNYSAGYNASTSGTTVDLSSQTNLFVTNDVNLAIGNTSGSAKELRLYEPNTSFSYSGANYTAFKAQAQSGNVTYTLPASDGTSGQSLTTNGGGTLAWASVAGLTGFTSALNTASPNNTVNASSLTASGGTTNQDAVIAPKGTGALLANIPDGGATGGNKRGSYAVDLQTYRTVNTQVASGNYSTIAGGYGNTASSICVGSLSGYNNNASGSYSVIAGGNANSITGSTSAIGGGTGNSATHDYAVVAGGSGNTASGDTSVVAGGYSNTASGSYSAVLSGGNNTASGDYSAVLGGASAKAYLYGALAQSGGMFSTQGDAQSLSCALRIKTTNATAAEMFLDGTSSRMSIPNNTVWLFRADIVAVRETYSADERAGFTIEGVITKKTTAGSTTFVGTPGKTVLGRDVAAWDADVVADTTNGALKLQVTGEASKNILWVAFVRITEVRA